MKPHSFKIVLMISAFSLLPFVSVAGDSEEQDVLVAVTPKKTESTSSKIVIEDQKVEVSKGSSVGSVTDPVQSEKNSVHYIFPEIGSLSNLIIKEKDGQRTTQEFLETKDDLDAYKLFVHNKLDEIKDPVQQIKTLFDWLNKAPKFVQNANVETRFFYEAFKANQIRERLKVPEWSEQCVKQNIDLQNILQCFHNLETDLKRYRGQLSQPLVSAAEARYIEVATLHNIHKIAVFEIESKVSSKTPKDFLERLAFLRKEKEQLEFATDQMESEAYSYLKHNRLFLLHSTNCDKHNLSVHFCNFLVLHKFLVPRIQVKSFQQELIQTTKKIQDASKRTEALTKKLAETSTVIEQGNVVQFKEFLKILETDQHIPKLCEDIQRAKVLVSSYKNVSQAYVGSIKKCIELLKQLLEILPTENVQRKMYRNELIQYQTLYLKALHLKRDFLNSDAVAAILDIEKTVGIQLTEESVKVDLPQIYKHILLLLNSISFMDMYPHFFIPFGQSEEGIKRAEVIQEIIKEFPLTFNEKVRLASFLSIATGDESKLITLLEEKQAREKVALEEKKARALIEQELLHDCTSSTRKTKQPQEKPKEEPKRSRNRTKKHVDLQPALTSVPLPPTLIDWVDEKNAGSKYQKTREERLLAHKEKSPKPGEVKIVVEDSHPVASKVEPKSPESLLKLNTAIDLASLYNLTGKAAKLDLQIQDNAWNMSKEDIVYYLNALGCTMRSEATTSEESNVKARTGHGSHHVLSLDIEDVLFKEKHLAYLINEKADTQAPKKKKAAVKKEQENIPVFVLPQWQQDNVPYYIRERLMVIRNMLFNFKVEEEKKP